MAFGLDDADYEAMFRLAENERLERKESANDRDRLCQALCAFANDLSGSHRPGVLIVGQRDDLSCADLRVDDALLLKIAGWGRDGKFQPLPVMSVEARTVDGCAAVFVTVAPSANTPVRYDDRTWIRVGPRRDQASPEEERILAERRRSGNLPFDARGVPDASLDDIDLVRFKLEYLQQAVPADVLAANGRTETEQLRALRMIDASGSPTAAAILVLGKDPQRFFPGAYVESLRLDGTALTDPILDRHRVTGPIADQLRRIDEIVDLWNVTSTRVGAAVREDRIVYPAAALRQLLRNAILHRNYDGTNAPVRLTWYSDRIEIISPGGVYGAVTPETFGQPGVTDYRNPTLAEAMRALGFAERFGVGLQIVRDELSRNGNPPLDWRIEANYVFVIVRVPT